MRVTRETLPLPRAIAPGVEIIAIGDIHGRRDLLEALLAAAPTREGRRVLVFTGDLVDRGPDSLGVLQLAAEAGARLGASETVALMGNHEILMRMTLDPAIPPRDAMPAMATWLHNGGDAVARQLLGDASPTLEALRAAAPASVMAWLQGLQTHYQSGGVLFVHAGVHPALPLASALSPPWDLPLSQVDVDSHWAWLREPFLLHAPDERGHQGLFVVHGHTPLDRGATRSHSEQARRFRLNIDGGSAMTGSAKMARLIGGVAEIVTVDA